MPEDAARATVEDYGYDDTYRYMRICPTCHELYEADRPDGEEQRCNCVPDAEARWPYHDFNQRALLCRCCGLNALRSGSRWSPYFCRECQLLAMGVSVWCRQLIFPIGRHSLMHTWVPNTSLLTLQAPKEPAEAAAGIFGPLRDVARGSDGLWLWYATVMPRNLQHFGLSGDVSLRTYLGAVAAEAPVLQDRLQAFEGLCRLFGEIPLDPAAGTAGN